MVAGILHDIGKIVFITSFPDRFQEALMVARLKKCTIVEAEEKVLGVTHTAVGRYLAEQWGLPAPFPAAVGAHHDLKADEDDLPMVHVVHMADYLAKVLSVGSAGDVCPPELNSEVADALDADTSTIEGWTGELAEYVKESLAALSEQAAASE